MPWIIKEQEQIERNEIINLTKQVAQECLERINRNPKRVLLLPPDITRAHSGAGWITNILYHFFAELSDVHIIPTLGQHIPHTEEQNRWMFGDIPGDKIHVHNWINGVKRIGEVPASFVKEVTGGKADWPIPISLNRILLEQDWDLIINIGHVVPHEVLGFSNHNKNYFIGLGGKETICASHMMAACYGIENNLGRIITPLRACFNKAERDFLGHLPDIYILLVMDYNEEGHLSYVGFYAGDDTETYLAAARNSMRHNITVVEPLKKVVAFMQGDEFHSTWVANKAIYRTRMAMADGGELLIIAPGLKRFGEQPEVDKIIRTYGYRGTDTIMRLWKREPLLQEFTHATAHLIHGSSEGRFKITYAPGFLTSEEIESVGYNYMDIDSALARYNPLRMKNGYNTMSNGEQVYYISTPSLGLWTTKERIEADEKHLQ